jgi:transposase
MNDFLRLTPLWRTDSVAETETQFIVEAELLSEPLQCPSCQRISAFSLYRHGTVRRTITDAPVRGKAVVIHFQQQRYICTGGKCRRTYFQPLDGVDETRLATVRLVRYVERQALLKPFRQVAQEVGLSDKTVRSVFTDYVARMDATHRFETPRVLSIDGVYVKRKERLILSDPERRLILALKPSVKERAVFDALCALPDRHLIEVVSQDMSHSLRRAVEAALPQAQIVVDTYHVLSLANDAVDRIRIDLRGDTKKRKSMIDRHLLRKHMDQLSKVDQARLQWWLDLVPEFKAAYETKESFFCIRYSSSSRTALERYEAWRADIPESVSYAFAPVIKTVENWKQQIFASLDHPGVNNGFAESMNRQVKELQQEGRRSECETIRAKIVYGTLLKQQDEAALSTRWRRTRSANRNAVKRATSTSQQPDEAIDPGGDSHSERDKPEGC